MSFGLVVLYVIKYTSEFFGHGNHISDSSAFGLFVRVVI